MATISPPPPDTGPDIGITAFRAALPPDAGDAATADRLCAIGHPAHLAKGEALPPDPREDRLVFIADGCA
ncbi:MAG TPA: hypothetical protein VK913_07160, partial [Erythrobacter sp.]|nr:hypothetical protein [Erythrobacter sp.]